MLKTARPRPQLGSKQAKSFIASSNTLLCSLSNNKKTPNFPFIATLIPFLFISWTIITLQTQAGKLVIECEATEVSVRLLRDGVVYDSLEVKNGETSTRLFAGKYEVIIDSPSDAILSEGDTIDVKRGETTIAHIKIDKDSKEPPAKQPQQTISEKMYMGKPLDYWLDVVDHEQHPETILDALSATAALVGDDTERVSERLLRRISQWSSTVGRYQKFEVQYNGQNTSRQPVGLSVDKRAFATLWECKPGMQYYELLAKQLAGEGTINWKDRVLSVGAKYPFERNLNTDLQAAKPLIQWLDANVLSKTEIHELVTSTTDLYFHWMHLNSLSEDDKQSVFNSLVQSKLSCEEWISIEVDRYKSQGLFPPLESELEHQAMKCLSSSDRLLQTKACCYLRHWKAQPRNVPNGWVQQVQQTPQQSSQQTFNKKEELIESIERLLTESLANPELITRTFKISTKIGRYDTPVLPAGVQSFNFNYPSMNETTDYILTRELLKLAEVVDTSHELAPLVLKIYKATDPLSQELAIALQKTPVRMVLWPELRTTPPNVGTREQWIAALIHAQALAILPERARNEITKMAERGLELAKEAPPPVVKPPLEDAAIEWARKQIEKFDRNHDGKLSADESRMMVIKPDGADTNSDGFITAEEFAIFRTKKR